MSSVELSSPDRRRLTVAIRSTMRELSSRLSTLNRQVSGRVALREIDLDCLDLVVREGPVTPGALARRAGLHPATMTGILDRLERAGWVARDRDPADRRSVVIAVKWDRGREILALYDGMNASMESICASYDETQLAVVADFLARVSQAGRDAAEELASG